MSDIPSYIVIIPADMLGFRDEDLEVDVSVDMFLIAARAVEAHLAVGTWNDIYQEVIDDKYVISVLAPILVFAFYEMNYKHRPEDSPHDDFEEFCELFLPMLPEPVLPGIPTQLWEASLAYVSAMLDFNTQ